MLPRHRGSASESEAGEAGPYTALKHVGVEALGMVADFEHAQLLQLYALEALTEVKAWVWAEHARLLPGVGPFSRDEAEGYAAYIEWSSRLEAAIQTLAQ